MEPVVDFIDVNKQLCKIQFMAHLRGGATSRTEFMTAVAKEARGITNVMLGELEEHGLVERYKPSGRRGKGSLRLTESGETWFLQQTSEEG